MNEGETLGVLDAALGRLRPLSYEELVSRIAAGSFMKAPHGAFIGEEPR